MRWALFMVLAAFSWTARYLGGTVADDPAGSALLALGCLIIGGVLSGELAVRLRLPKITGYLVFGMIAGPHAVGVETFRDASLLRLFEDLALGLIALTAGGEFRLAVIRRRLRPLLAITVAHTVGIFLIVAGTLWTLLTFVPFLGPVSQPELLAGVALLAVIAVAVSPATTIAVITDLGARGEMVETVLGVTILKDLAEVEENLKSLRPYAVRYLKSLIKKHRGEYPRRTKIETFKALDVRTSADAIRVAIEAGF